MGRSGLACQKGLQNFKPGGGNATARLGNAFSYGSYGLLLGLSAAQSQAGTQGQEGNGAGDDIGADSGFVAGLGAGIGGRSLLEHEGDTAVAARRYSYTRSHGRFQSSGHSWPGPYNPA